jgi:hypothetical protein
LTEDIYAAATEIGGEAAAAQLRRVDQFYRAGQNRIATALEPFENMDGSGGGRAAYDRILSLARVGGSQNSRALQSLRNSLRPDEWREVAATIIDDMGHVANSNPQALEAGAFSVDRFVTNYARLSDDGRRILFGGRGTENLFGELDNLARVAGYQKGVEAMANRSRSGINVQNVGFGAALLNPSSAPSALAGLAGMAITGEMLTNPGFVRWLTSASRSGASVGGARQHLAALARLASRDPALMPLYTDLAQRLGVSPENPQAQPQPRREPELQP